MSSDSAKQSAKGKSQGRLTLRRFLIGAGIAIVLLVVFHRPILRGAYDYLSVEDPLQHVSLVVVSGADRLGLDRATELIQQGHAERILIVERRLPRISKLGITPRPGDAIRRELRSRGVSEAVILTLTTDALTSWQVTRALDEHLRSNHNDAKVAMICTQHHARYVRYVLNRTVGQRAAKYLIWTYEPYGFDADTWWRKRTALVKVAIGYLRLMHAIGFGEGEFDADNWSPDAYEDSIRLSASKAA